MTINFTNCFKYAFLFAIIFTFNFVANAQKKQVDVNLPAANIQSIFSAIEKQTGYTFNYNAAALNLKTKYRFVYKGNIEGALNSLANLAMLELKQNGQNILVRVLPSRMVKGLITDDKGNPVPGVIVQLKNGAYLTTSDGNGNYSTMVSGDDIATARLLFKMIGMVTLTSEPLGDKRTVNVTMSEDVTSMQEVVITSSYTKPVKREEVVGSITQINAAQLQVDRPIESVDKLLEGLAAGVYVEGSTELGTPVKINIRGQGSLIPVSSLQRTTSSQPLIVIDGIPVQEQLSPDAVSAFNAETLLNPLAGINPNNIESISVLKDAAASTIYGSNAANGVIIITTKSGSAGATKANIKYSRGVSTFINELKLLSGPEYYLLKKELLMNEGATELSAAQQAGSSTINTDWLSLISRNASYNNLNLDFSGGKGSSTYYVSAGYRDQQASSLKNDIKNFYLSLKLNNEISKKLKLSITLSPTYGTKNGISTFGSNTYLPPNIAPTDNETLNTFAGIDNPVNIIEQNENSSRSLTFNGNANLRYTISPEFYVSGTIGANMFYNKQRIYQSADNYTGRTVSGRLRIIDRSTYNWLGFLQAGYDKKLGKHSIGAIVGYEAKEDFEDQLMAIGNGFTYDKIREVSQARNKSIFSSRQSTGTISYYTQIGYDYEKKYFVTGSARMDESSIFGGDKQRAINSAVGLAWILTKENFLQPGKVLSMLKLRASYGTTGNSRIGSYASRGLYDFSSENYTGDAAAVPLSSAAPNPQLGWEKNRKLNFGLDFSLFNRINITAEYYNNTIRDLISNVDVPLETGYSSIPFNTATMRNQGFELNIDAAIINGEHFKWRTSLNLGTNKNGIVSLNNTFTEVYGSSERATALKAGYSSTAIWGVRWAGINPQTGAEQFYDPSGNIVNRAAIVALGNKSWQVIGDRLPKFQGGSVNTFQYKDFALTLNFQYSYGADYLLSNRYYADGNRLIGSNMSVNLLDRWQKPGDVTEVAKLSRSAIQIQNSDRYIYDLSYIKLSNAALSYNLPEKFAGKIMMRTLSLYVNATNIFYWYKDSAPENRNGIREFRYTYPELRTISFGVNFGF
ncbi:SusC/RagA family TonB-linked outer membrane protein [Pedobacter aquatilis]|uniref:SusC/RagA family TonB-linked outer membrane protein n=1 Tax=Pedobacter aquatilis TaxID=351343 RepID=UPI00292FAC15|nr:SusC/RagA family TonB-linked outer membrane protein [Pedobacter aquatilis]